jgi:hypothetical protein
MLGPSSRATARPGPTARNGAAVERRPCAPSSPPPGEPSAVERSAATLVQLAGAIEALARAIGVRGGNRDVHEARMSLDTEPAFPALHFVLYVIAFGVVVLFIVGMGQP